MLYTYLLLLAFDVLYLDTCKNYLKKINNVAIDFYKSILVV